jgi:hypothetical protein
MNLPEIDPIRSCMGSIRHGLGLNLLVRDVIAAATLQATVLAAQINYWEEHFAIIEAVRNR